MVGVKAEGVWWGFNLRTNRVIRMVLPESCRLDDTCKFRAEEITDNGKGRKTPAYGEMSTVPDEVDTDAAHTEAAEAAAERHSGRARRTRNESWLDELGVSDDGQGEVEDETFDPAELIDVRSESDDSSEFSTRRRVRRRPRKGSSISNTTKHRKKVRRKVSKGKKAQVAAPKSCPRWQAVVEQHCPPQHTFRQQEAQALPQRRVPTPTGKPRPAELRPNIWESFGFWEETGGASIKMVGSQQSLDSEAVRATVDRQLNILTFETAEGRYVEVNCEEWKRMSHDLAPFVTILGLRPAAESRNSQKAAATVLGFFESPHPSFQHELSPNFSDKLTAQAASKDGTGMVKRMGRSMSPSASLSSSAKQLKDEVAQSAAPKSNSRRASGNRRSSRSHPSTPQTWETGASLWFRNDLADGEWNRSGDSTAQHAGDAPTRIRVRKRRRLKTVSNASPSGEQSVGADDCYSHKIRHHKTALALSSFQPPSKWRAWGRGDPIQLLDNCQAGWGRHRTGFTEVNDGDLTARLRECYRSIEKERPVLTASSVERMYELSCSESAESLRLHHDGSGEGGRMSADKSLTGVSVERINNAKENAIGADSLVVPGSLTQRMKNVRSIPLRMKAGAPRRLTALRRGGKSYRIDVPPEPSGTATQSWSHRGGDSGRRPSGSECTERVQLSGLRKVVQKMNKPRWLKRELCRREKHRYNYPTASTSTKRKKSDLGQKKRKRTKALKSVKGRKKLLQSRGATKTENKEYVLSVSQLSAQRTALSAKFVRALPVEPKHPKSENQSSSKPA